MSTASASMSLLASRGSLISTVAAVIVGALCFVMGITTFLHIQPLCWLVALSMLAVGILTAAFEASPLLVKVTSAPLVQRMADLQSGRPLWYRAAVYGGFAFFLLIMYWVLCSSEAVLITMILYTVMTVFVIVLHLMAKPQPTTDLPTTSPSGNPIGGDAAGGYNQY